MKEVLLNHRLKLPTYKKTTDEDHKKMTELSTIPISRLNNTELDIKIKTEIDKNGTDLSTITTNCITEIPQDIKLELNDVVEYYGWEYDNDKDWAVLYTKTPTIQVGTQLYNSAKEEYSTIQTVNSDTSFTNPLDGTRIFVRNSNYDNTARKLILKAGSKIWIPYGTTEVYQVGDTDAYNHTVIATSWDGSKFFYAIEFENDTVVDTSTLSVDNEERLLTYTITDDTFGWDVKGKFVVGTETDASVTSCLYYNTNTNVFSHNNAGQLICAFPICSFVANTTAGVVDKITQTFNGFGYFYMMVYTLPNIKMLASNGRNEDGTLKNFEITTDKVYTYRYSSTHSVYNFSPAFVITNGGVLTGIDYIVSPTIGSTPPASGWFYNTETNRVYYINSSGWKEQPWIMFGYATTKNGVIQKFTPATTFRAVDYNDAVLNYGDQDIGGNKNFMGSLTVERTNSSNVPFRVRRSDITYGTKPSETKEGEVIRLVDSTNNWLLGALKYKYKTDGSFAFYLLGRSPIDSSIYTANIGLGYLADGTPYVMGVQPPTTSNSNTTMPTTSWTRTVCVGNPNYNAAVSRTVGTTYTAATNGWVRVDSKQADNITCKLIIDGAHTPYQVYCGEYFDGNIAVIIPVAKGQTYKGENLVSMWWYPSI